MEIFFAFATAVGSIWVATGKAAHDYHHVQPQQHRYEQAAQTTQKLALEVQQLNQENKQLHEELCQKQAHYLKDEEFYLSNLKLIKNIKRSQELRNKRALTEQDLKELSQISANIKGISFKKRST
ncbi:hypothetical protein KBD08_03320 [Candidatus Babeliales bacterium]|nr:hypothetical protein [Candidatus Babeliales bacterium]